MSRHCEYLGEISDLGISLKVGYSKAVFEWPHFTKYELTGQNIYLYSGNSIEQCFSRNLLKDKKEWGNVIELVAKKVGSN